MKDAAITDTIITLDRGRRERHVGNDLRSAGDDREPPDRVPGAVFLRARGLIMPILGPLADFADVDRSLAVTAFQSASGIVNYITVTSAVVMGGLVLAKVRYDHYLRFACRSSRW